jgi:hypothetical protein
VGFFGHYRGQQDMAEAVNRLAGKVVPAEIELESAVEMLNAGRELVSVELSDCAGGLLKIITRDHFYNSSKFRLTLCRSVLAKLGFNLNFQNPFCEAQPVKNFFVFDRLV